MIEQTVNRDPFLSPTDRDSSRRNQQKYTRPVLGFVMILMERGPMNRRMIMPRNKQKTRNRERTAKTTLLVDVRILELTNEIAEKLQTLVSMMMIKRDLAHRIARETLETALTPELKRKLAESVRNQHDDPLDSYSDLIVEETNCELSEDEAGK